MPELGGGDYVSLYERIGFELEALAEDCRELLESTERAWIDGADRLLRRRAGVGLDDAGPWDLPRLLRAEDWDDAFPADRMLPALEATLADLGVDLAAQANVHLDVEQRPLKSPRAFCAPIEVPERVVLVIQPNGGVDDWRALFHEAGHTEHFANTDGGLSVEARRMGDSAVTEGWASLFEGLVREPAWLERRLDVGRPRQLAAEGGVVELFFARRYAAKLLYELEFHRADDPETMRGRYVELLGEALKIEPSRANYLGDIDAGFYVTEYLRSWGFEAAAARLPADRVRQRVVHAAGGGRPPARAVVGGAVADRGRDAPGPDRVARRDGGARRAHSREPRTRVVPAATRGQAVLMRGSAPSTHDDRGARADEGLRRQACRRRPHVRRPPRASSPASSARTASGKSTTMRLILGLDRPTAGTSTVNGKPYRDHAAPLHEVGALLEARAVHTGRSAATTSWRSPRRTGSRSSASRS